MWLICSSSKVPIHNLSWVREGDFKSYILNLAQINVQLLSLLQSFLHSLFASPIWEVEVGSERHLFILYLPISCFSWSTWVAPCNWICSCCNSYLVMFFAKASQVVFFRILWLSSVPAHMVDSAAAGTELPHHHHPILTWNCLSQNVYFLSKTYEPKGGRGLLNLKVSLCHKQYTINLVTSYPSWYRGWLWDYIFLEFLRLRRCTSIRLYLLHHQHLSNTILPF